MFLNRSPYDYITKSEFARIKRFSKGKKTPFLVIDIEKISQKSDELTENQQFAKVYFAVTSNPEDKLLKMLAKKGSYFNVATIYELDQLLKLKISSNRLSFGNAIKKEEDIVYAYKKGIRMFVSDSISDVKKLAKNAPKSNVFFRTITEGGSAD